MDTLNIRDSNGVVHGLIDHRNTDCFTVIEEGWVLVWNSPTCIGCLGRTPETLDFAHRMAQRVAWKARERCLKEVLNNITLRKGDQLNYRHTFIVECVIIVDDDGNIVLSETIDPETPL